MKTYEGTFTIKWWKNDNGDVRPLTIDCEKKDELNGITAKCKKVFMGIGENGRLAYSVNFDLALRP